MTETSQGLTPAVSSGAYLLNITFDKKGNFSLTEQMKLKKLNASGTWDFNAGLGSEKKKEKLVIALKDVSASKTPGYHLFNQNSTKFIYTIKELRNKRMALKAELPIYIDADGSEQTFYGEFVFIQ